MLGVVLLAGESSRTKAAFNGGQIAEIKALQFMAGYSYQDALFSCIIAKRCKFPLHLPTVARVLIPHDHKL